MKVLLINPPIENIIWLEIPSFVRENEGLFPPLGLMYIASYLKEHVKCEVKMLDALAENMSGEAIAKYAENFSPDIIGITVHTHNLIDVILLIRLIKKWNSHVHICLGGPHVNAFPEEIGNIPFVDSAVLNEGEVTFMELVSKLRAKSDFNKIKGIFFREEGIWVRAGLRENPAVLDNLPFPDRNLVDYKKYLSILGKKSLMTTMLSSRGCPYQCTFCSTPKGFYRMRSPENIVNEMEDCIQLGIREIHFVDDTFNVNIDRVIEMCNEIKKRKLKVKWSFRGRIDKITEVLLKKVKEAGCFRIHLGVETSSDEGLKRLKKGITVEQIRQVFQWVRSMDISTVAYFLIGCPHEKNREDVLKTVTFAKEIDPDFALFNLLTPYPATELYEDGLMKKVLKGDYWREFSLRPQKSFTPQLWQEWLGQDELFELLKVAYRSFYLRPKFLLRILKIPQDPKIMAKRLKAGLEILKLSFK